jgi:hypothetical protein
MCPCVHSQQRLANVHSRWINLSFSQHVESQTAYEEGTRKGAEAKFKVLFKSLMEQSSSGECDHRAVELWLRRETDKIKDRSDQQVPWSPWPYLLPRQDSGTLLVAYLMDRIWEGWNVDEILKISVDFTLWWTPEAVSLEHLKHPGWGETNAEINWWCLPRCWSGGGNICDICQLQLWSVLRLCQLSHWVSCHILQELWQ